MEEQLRKWGSRLNFLGKRAARQEGAKKQVEQNKLKQLVARRSRAEARLSMLKSTPYDAANWQQLRLEAEEAYLSMGQAMRTIAG